MFRQFVIFIMVGLWTVWAQADVSEAHWITAFENQSATNTWLCFRRDIRLDTLPRESVNLKIAADSKYWMWINGRLVVNEGGLKRGPNPKDTYCDVIERSVQRISLYPKLNTIKVDTRTGLYAERVSKG